MKSLVKKRSVAVGDHKTSISLEEPFWDGIRDIACASGMTLSRMVQMIDAKRQHGNLSSAIRLFVLEVYREAPQRETSAEKAAAVAVR